jgi:type II secretory pathway pseudopilin PulG
MNSAREGGFTLVEVMISLLILVLAMATFLLLIDTSAKTNKKELDLSDAQQSVRASFNMVLRDARGSRVGGLAYITSVIPIYDNVVAGKTITDDNGNTVPIRPGTDVFAVRGVLRTSVMGLSSGTPPPYDPTTGTFTVQGNSGMNYNSSTGLPSGAPSNFSTSSDGMVAGLLAASAANKVYFLMSDISTGSYGVYSVSAPGTYVAANGICGPNPCVQFHGVGNDPSAMHFDVGGNAPTPQFTGQLGGLVDEVIYFVEDDNPALPPLDQHPRLVMGQYVSGDGSNPMIIANQRYRLSTVAQDIEDLQVAYFVAPNATTPYQASETLGANPNAWVGKPTDAGGGAGPLVQPTAFQDLNSASLLKGVRIAVVAKSADPDQKSADALYGYGTVDPSWSASPGTVHVENSGLAGSPNTAIGLAATKATSTPFRRRVINIAFDLRNFQN